MPIQNLKREIHAIESKTEGLVAQIQEAYGEYLDRLGITVQRQLIAACYHLCTQLFPDVFLQLKYSDREKMQRSLQSLAEEAKGSLTLSALGARILEEPDAENEDLFLDSFETDPDAEDADLSEEEDDFLEEEEAQAPAQSATDPEADWDANPDSESTPSQADPSQPPSLTNPQVLVDWYSEIEQAIGDVLRTVSQKATQVLEQSGIIHNQLPSPLLEVATQSEAAENLGSDHPNILNLVVEMGKISEEGRKSSTQRIEIIAVYLRLSDLEFTDTYLVSHRNKLRSQFQQLKSLSKIYHKRSREYSIAQAEAAWRSSWLED
ncbi:MAG: hypothetical protein ACO31I_01465 [Prochlorotrichaceae cyanobacterium]|jgi:hypothetical protein